MSQSAALLEHPERPTEDAMIPFCVNMAAAADAAVYKTSGHAAVRAFIKVGLARHRKSRQDSFHVASPL